MLVRGQIASPRAPAVQNLLVQWAQKVDVFNAQGVSDTWWPEGRPFPWGDPGLHAHPSPQPNGIGSKRVQHNQVN